MASAMHHKPVFESPHQMGHDPASQETSIHTNFQGPEINGECQALFLDSLAAGPADELERHIGTTYLGNGIAMHFVRDGSVL